MRIRPPPSQLDPWNSARRRAEEWLRARKGLVPVLLAVATCAALIAAFGLWYGFEGRGVVDPLLRRWFPPERVPENDLATLQFEIGEDAYRALSSQRSSALERGILPDVTDWQPASVQFDGETVPVGLRLAGDNADHWQEHKWSLHVQVESGPGLLEMRTFSLQSPATCGYLSGWLYAQDLSLAGLLTPRHTFVNVSVNGDKWGVYALEERISREFLSLRGLDEGIVVRLGRDTLSTHPWAPAFDLAFAEIESPDAPGDARSARHLAAARERVHALESGELGISEVFDTELVGRALAHADLWGVEGWTSWPAGTYYYDPVEARLVPIGGARVPALVQADAPLTGMAQSVDLALAEAYAREVVRISEPAYLEAFDALGDTFARYRTALMQEFFPAYLPPPWEALAERQRMLSDAVRPAQTVRAYLDSDTPHSTEIRVANILGCPIALDQVRVGDHALPIETDWIPDGDRALLYQEAIPSVVLRPAQKPVPRYVTLHIPTPALEGESTDLASSALQIVTHLIGVDEPVIVDVERNPSVTLSASDLPERPSVREALERHPFLVEAEQPGYLALRPGTWHVEGDLVLPEGYGLAAVEPVTLTFDQQAALVATGPLLLHGPDGQGIHLLPEGEAWAGMVVWHAGVERPSSLYNVEIRATTGIQREGWQTSGGVTFYASPVHLHRCRLLNTTARQAIWVGGGDFEFVLTEFAYAAFDALAGDRARGRVEQSTFHDVLGRGIVLNESSITVEDTSLLRVYGMGISANNSSVVSARGVRAVDVGVAVASTDMSTVDVQDVFIAQAWVAGFAAYLQDLKGGTADISASRIRFVGDSLPALVQRGGRVRLDRSAGIASLGELDTGLLQQRRMAAMPIRVVDYSFGPAIRLAGYDLRTTELARGETVQLILYWQATTKVARDYTVFVHVLNGAGQIAAQWDAMPRENTFLTTAWPVGEMVDDLHRVPLAPDLPPGTYQIEIGMYDGQTRERLPISGPDGEAIADAAIRLDRPVRVR